MSISKINNSNEISDKDIYKFASIGPDDRYRKVSQNALKTLLITVPVADCVISGVLKKGDLGAKLTKSAKTAGVWGAGYIALFGVIGLKNFINSKSETLNNINKDHKFLSFGFDVTVIYLAMKSVLSAVKSVNQYFKENFAKMDGYFNKNFKKPLKNVLNESFVNKKLVIPAENYFSKKPYNAVMNKFVSKFFVPVATLTVLFKMTKEKQNRNDLVAVNYNFLKNIKDYSLNSESNNSEEA